VRPDIINENGTSKIKFFKEIADVGRDSIVPPTGFTHDSNLARETFCYSSPITARGFWDAAESQCGVTLGVC